MSQATHRHDSAQPLKGELLKEIKHWSEAAGHCLKEINNNLSSLKLSRDVAKREIHSARALLEEHLRVMEQRALDKLETLVQGELKVFREYNRKLQSHQKRLTHTATTLEDNVVGTRLTRTLQDGKEHVSAVRDTLIAVRKQNLAIRVAFDLNEHLVPMVNDEYALGTSSLKTMMDNRMSNQTSSSETKSRYLTRYDEDGRSNKLQVHDVPKNDVPAISNSDNSRKKSHNPDYINELVKLEQEISATLHKSRRQRNSVIRAEKTDPNWSSDNQQTTTTSKVVKVAAERITDPLSFFNVKKYHSKAMQRPLSLRPSTYESRDQITVHVRISKSARDDTRLPANEPCVARPIETYTFDKDQQYLTSDEQGPDRILYDDDRRSKEKPSVRYLGYDFIKEITSIDGDTDNTLTEDVQSQVSSQDQPHLVPKTSGFSRPSSRDTSCTSISTVSYKPPSKHASAPVYRPARRQAKSFFTYSSRFHTKKHPDDTDLCRLAGIAALDSGQVVVSDISHLQVMLFAPDFTYLFALECPSPCGMCVVSANVVAVTLFRNRKLLLLKVHSIHMEKFREININCQGSLYAVSYKNNQYYVLSFGGGIHVLNKDGKQVRVVNTCMTGGVARHLEVSDDGRHIYVTGPDNVVCFSEFGDTLWQYQPGRKQFTPGGVILHHGRLFVTNWRAHRVLELSMEGTHVRDVIVDNVEYPQSLAIHSTSSKLFVVQSHMFKQEAQTRKIRVFDIK